MSATLTWFNSGLGAKTGTTANALIDDLVTLFNSKLADANFLWQVASSNSTATSPQYVVLKRKDGSPGRILLVNWSSSPAGNNAAILDQGPATGALYIVWFPNGNVDTPSNLNAASGTILGNDTGCTKVSTYVTTTSVYTTSFQPFYFESAEAIFFGFQNPAAITQYGFGAGNFLVDMADNAYGAVYGCGTNGFNNFGATSILIPWAGPKPAAGSNTICVRTNYGSTDRTYFQGWSPTGWAGNITAIQDPLVDAGSNKVWFAPFYLMGQTKGEGIVLKFRQIAIGTFSTGAFTVYNTNGPVVAARQFCAQTAGSYSCAWFTNFKI